MSVPPQPGLDAITQDNPGTQSTSPSTGTFTNVEKTFTEADIAKVRKEEKDKLYSEINSLKDQWASAQKTLSEIQAQRDSEAADTLRKEQEKESKAKAKKEDEMSAKKLLEEKLRETNETWEQRFNQLINEREQERAVVEKERQYSDLVNYRNGRLTELTEEVAPQFHSFISGDSREQIDAAIEQAKVATQSIWSEVQQATQQVQQQPRGVSPTGYSAFGPLDNNLGQKTYTSEDINKMSMAEYEEFRKNAGIASGDAFRNRGLFG